MTHSRHLTVGPIRLDLIQERLWHGAEELRLRPKTFAVLTCLAQHPGRLVTKQELLAAGWPRIHISDAAIKTCIAEIRRALRNQSVRAFWIETRRRGGYRIRLDDPSIVKGSIDTTAARESGE